ncbi:calcium-binding and coiled-coil domain-containing protein 2 isoform X2 [Anarrhichthys ocellatus]|uniref:calcium-binding and coiled-coil domain-containing protein 2 isoform X2 n=1 Tax=Anarrhichthys ocellatus TaxID=433405 RepID=UPI0012ED452C|nr:calcium-binding and coiled-coil domain-containing protein 2 isoform X2 [Anarrhichthys ocellatus]
MESAKDAADSTARTFSQVVFTDTLYSYPPSTPVTCCYTITTAYQPHSRDWVGIFKVGWSTTKDYHTFVWVEPSLDVVGQESATRQAVFTEYYLPKDELDFYQFCYVDSAGQVRGASTPFCFKNPAGQNPESSMDEDLMVITTQEQVELSRHERAELQKELDRIRGENKTLKNDLQMEQQQAASMKGQNEQKEKEMSQLVREMDQIKERNENLKSTLQQKVKETDGLKVCFFSLRVKSVPQFQSDNYLWCYYQEEMMKQQRGAEEQNNQSLSLDGASRQNETHAQEKYDRAVIKIKLLKEEREQLSRRVDAQSEETTMLKSKLGEQERQLFKMRDSIQLLQVDLQSSEKKKERLSAELLRSQSIAHDVDDVKTENQELCRRLARQMTLQNCSDDELKVKCQTLDGQLQDAQRKLAAEREEAKNTKRRAESLEKDLQQVREQLKKVASTCEDAQRISGKQELQLKMERDAMAEARETLADKDSLMEEKEQKIMLERHEKEELARENQTLMSDIAGLRRAYAELQAPPPADSPHLQHDTNTSAANEWQQQQESPEQADNPYENIDIGAGTEEESLVCRHCQECFPCITRNELEQHERSHRVCPFCTMICDNMEQSVFEDHVYSHEL